ncbi:MAG: tetratricopeptide repeat protein [Gammaproteobacteria bacterium]
MHITNRQNNSARPICRSMQIAALLLSALLSFNVVANAEVQSLIKQGALDQALARADAGLQVNANDVELRFLKGLILTRQNKLAEAERIFVALTNDHPSLPEPYNNLAVVYAAQGNYDKARETLRSAINTHPSYATAHENIGDIYAKMASDAYSQALQLDRANAAAREKLSLVNELFSANMARHSSLAKVDEQMREQPAVAARSPEPAAAEPQPPAEPAPEPEPEPKPEPKPEPALAAAQAELLPVPESPETTVRSTAPPQPKPVAQVTPPVEPATEPAPASDNSSAIRRELVRMVRDWAAAWSAQDVPAYLDHYADNFNPGDGMSRAEWAEQRQIRLTSPAYIQVDLRDIQTPQIGSNHARVRFQQTYSSDTYGDEVTKTLILVKTGSRWQISEELTD